MTESGCASLLSLFPEIKTQIRILLEDPQSSTYAQIQKFGSFFHDKQLSDPFLFANGKKFVQYLNMLRQIGMCFFWSVCFALIIINMPFLSTKI